MFTPISKRLVAAVESATDSVGPGETAGPRGRPSWSGLLRLSLVTVPIKAYPAHRGAGTTPFNQLHANCGERIQHQKRCPMHGAVEAAEITHGFQSAPDQYVRVEPEEMESVCPPKDKALVLEQFIAMHGVDPVLFAGRSLCLVPDGVAARHPYAAVAEAPRAGNTWALGRVVLSVNRQLVLIRPRGRLLVLDVLHFPREVRAAKTWEAELGDHAASAEELRLIGTLIDSASGPVDWSSYRDVRAEEMTALIEAKIAGQPLRAPASEPVAQMRLLDALKQSVAAVKSKFQKPHPRRRATP